MTILSQPYESPEMTPLEFSPEAIICSSPVGSSEGIDFEDWTI